METRFKKVYRIIFKLLLFFLGKAKKKLVQKSKAPGARVNIVEPGHMPHLSVPDKGGKLVYKREIMFSIELS